MTVAFDALVASVTPNFVTLADVQVAEALAVWTATGANSYYCSWNQYDATAVVAGGIYRRLDSVRINGTTLTLRADAAAVDANASSYFFDAAASRIYVRPLTAVHPNTYAFVGAFFTLFFANGPVSFSDRPPYWPLITGELPSFAGELADPLFGATTSETGAVTLLNGDRLFDRLAQKYIWRNKRVTFRLGGASLSFSDFTVVGTMQINGIGVSDEAAVIALESIGRVLNRSIPPANLSEISGFDVEVSESASMPWLFGHARDCNPPFTNVTGGTQDKYFALDDYFAIAGLHALAYYAIARTDGARTIIDPATLTISTQGFSVPRASFPREDYDIWVEFVRNPGTFGNIVEDLLLALGVSPADIDSTAFDAVDANATHPHTLGIYLTEPIEAAEVVRRLEQSAMGQVRIDAAGKWSARLFDPSAADWTLTDEDFVSWEPETELTATLNEVRVQYDNRHANKSSVEASASNDAVLYASETSDSHIVLTYLREREAAEAVANHLLFLKSHPGTKIAFEERGLKLMGAQVGDMVAVTRSRAPVARTGAYEGQLLKLVKLEKTLGPVPIVRGLLWDMGGNADRIARCLDSAVDLNWSAATAAQKAFYGFCCDDDGYIDSADPATRHLKVVW